MFIIFYTDKPVFKSEPVSADAEEGKSVSLSCDIDGNPKPQITWTHDDSKKVNLLTRFKENLSIRKWPCAVCTRPVSFSRLKSKLQIYTKHFCAAHKYLGASVQRPVYSNF